MAELNSITKTAAKLTKHLSQVRGLYRGIFHVSLWLGHFWVSKHSSFVSRQHCLFGSLSTIYLEFLAQLWLSSSGKVDIVRDAHVIQGTSKHNASSLDAILLVVKDVRNNLTQKKDSGEQK